MKITVQSSKAVKPDYGAAAAPATTTVVPLTAFDLISFNDYMFGIHAFHPPSPPASALEAGLARALAEHREWAGRLVAADPATGRRGILLNDAGVQLLEATAADSTIETAMPLLRQPTPEVRRLHPSTPGGGAGGGELMLFQVTRFACGSFVVGHAMHHAVGDAFAISRFLVAWGQATRGAAVAAAVHDRTSFFSPRHPPRVEFDHRGAEFAKPPPPQREKKNVAGGEVVVVQHVRFSREFISELKSSAAAAGAPPPGRRPYSTAQCLAAHLWRCVTRARGLAVAGAGGETTTKTTLHVAVNGRARMRGLPEGYTGNAVLWAHPAATAHELLAAPVGRATVLVGSAVARVDEAYFRSFIDFASSGAVEEEGLVPAASSEAAEELGADVAVYCLLRVPFYDVDFGGGGQFFYTPGYYPAEGVVYILPPAPPMVGDGSVEAHVSLFSRHVEAFKACCFSIDAGEEASPAGVGVVE
ncbi:unnamed protein product [Urochloa humidicola]